MRVKVRLLRPRGYARAGKIMDVTEGEANLLVERLRVAEYVQKEEVATMVPASPLTGSPVGTALRGRKKER
jgi:hypothetical protein